VRITVLGKSPAWQDAGGACSGYLVEGSRGGETTRLLVDCGNGVFGKLRERVDYAAVDAVVVSHLHADHFLDLVPYAYALAYAPRRAPAPVPGRPRLLAPPGARETLRRVTGAWGSDDLVERAFDVCEYDPSDVLEIGTLKICFHSVPHFVPTWAIEVRDADGGRFTYGADCRPCDELVAFARGTDLLMVEATLAHPEHAEPRGHLTPREAGEHARRAGARRLVVTHFPDELGERWVMEEARLGFGREHVEIAREGATFIV